MNYQLVIFRFNYAHDLICYWPIFFELTFANQFGKKTKEDLQKVMNDLSTMPGISNLSIAMNKTTNLSECQSTFDAIINRSADDDSVAIKYLVIENQVELRDIPKFDYSDNQWYTSIDCRRSKFPVRVRAHQFKFLLDEIELPLILLKEEK